MSGCTYSRFESVGDIRMCAELRRKEGRRASVNSELQPHLNKKSGGAHESGAAVAVVKQVEDGIQRAAALDEIRE